MTTKEAVNHLVKELKADADYYYTWQANIAMAFKDEFDRSYLSKGVHEMATKAAKDFLELLCASRTDPEPANE